MKKTVLDLKVSTVTKLSPAYLLLVLTSPIPLKDIAPGQFANLEIPNNKQVYLRRPFSVHDVQGNKISFLIKIIGKGTETLAGLPSGSNISVIFPLGNGFKLQKGGQAMLIGGGCGVAPLLFLAKELDKQKVKVTIILGGKKEEDIVRLKEFEKYGRVMVTTENGSIGTKGFVTAVLNKLNISNFNNIYTCGPEAMLRGIHKIAKDNKVNLQVSLEGMMGCGFGVCLCCVTPTKKEGHLCVCKDGPVFESERLPW